MTNLFLRISRYLCPVQDKSVDASTFNDDYLTYLKLFQRSKSSVVFENNSQKMYVSGIKQYLSLEPVYFSLCLAYEIVHLVDENLYLQKTCRNFTLSEPNLSTPCDNEKRGIEFVASVHSHYELWGGIITVTMIVLTSAWSDKAPDRSKSSILILMWIELLQMISMCWQAYSWNWPVLAAVLTETIFWPILGIRVASIIYICNITTIEDRTFRLTLLHVLQMLSSLIGRGSSGYLLRNLGFFYSYMLCAVLVAISVLYASIFMEKRTSENAADVTTKGCIKVSGEFFDVRSVIRAFNLVFGKQSGNERIIIILMSAISILSTLCFYGKYIAIPVRNNIFKIFKLLFYSPTLYLILIL